MARLSWPTSTSRCFPLQATRWVSSLWWGEAAPGGGRGGALQPSDQEGGVHQGGAAHRLPVHENRGLQGGGGGKGAGEVEVQERLKWMWSYR